MNTKLAADAFNQLSEAFAKLAIAIESPGAGHAPASSAARALPAAGDVPPIPAALPPSFDDLPPEEDVTFSTPSGPVRATVTATAKPALAEKRWDVCPKHGTLWRTGSRGNKYCPTKTDDPAWANPKGWCSITDKTAAKWVEIQRAIPA